MNWNRAISTLAIASAFTLSAFGQGGFGGALGGGQGGQQGQIQSYDGSVRAIEEGISRYLDGDEVKNILTPGEYSEWPLTLKDGQVVIAEARSDAFDPALEVVDDKGKVLASNDDRYPGDQRPLLLWRCEKGGAYSLRARCFHDKSGGQFFLRLRTYDSIDAGSEKTVEQVQEGRPNPGSRVLVRVPMKAGQIKQLGFDDPDRRGFLSAAIAGFISPTGLPDIELGKPLAPIIPNVLMAPVDGDYYAIADLYGNNRRARATAREIVPTKLTQQNGVFSAKSNTNVPSLWKLGVKAGDILEASTPELALQSQMAISEEPDISTYDLKKPETNPFFPHVKDKAPIPAFSGLPGRARDGRVSVFIVQREATLWLASNGFGPNGKEYTLTVKPAAQTFGESQGLGSQLGVGYTDYWAFDAKVGDVMTFDFTAANFAEQLLVRDPTHAERWSTLFAPDQQSSHWDTIVDRPGKYLVAVSCMGDGGGGKYTLYRKVYHAKEFSKGSPAEGDFSDGQVHVWKFTAKPNEPLLVRWKSSDWSYRREIRDDSGAYAGLPLTQIDGSTQYGILKVDQPTTFLIVLYPGSKNAKYS